MGTAYDEGLGKAEEPGRAALWYQRAAEQGHVFGAHNLGNAYSEAGVWRRTRRRPLNWWTQCNRRRDVQAQEALAKLGK